MFRNYLAKLYEHDIHINRNVSQQNSQQNSELSFRGWLNFKVFFTNTIRRVNSIYFINMCGLQFLHFILRSIVREIFRIYYNASFITMVRKKICTRVFVYNWWILIIISFWGLNNYIDLISFFSRLRMLISYLNI